MIAAQLAKMLRETADMVDRNQVLVEQVDWRHDFEFGIRAGPSSTVVNIRLRMPSEFTPAAGTEWAAHAAPASALSQPQRKLEGPGK